MTTPEPLPLAAEFPRATDQQWRTLVDGVLKGASFDKTLVHKTYDGLTLQPLYPRRANAQPVTGRVPGTPWQIMARVDHPDPKEANTQALDDLQNGASGLVLVCPGCVSAQGFGIDTSAEGLAQILDGIYLDAGAPIEFQLTRAAKDVPDHVAAIVKQRGLKPEECDLRIGFDPIGLMAVGSSERAPWENIAPVFAGMTRKLSDEGFRGPFAAADARLVHDAGGSEAQELSYAIAVAVAYLRALEAGGIALDDARRMIFFRMSADADQFMTMAKFRALRKLWARVEQACGLQPKPVFVAADTAWRMMTTRDPYVNMLRTTIAAFSAGLGGADAVTVLPHNTALGLPDGFARRVARNAQLVLLEESNLAKVSDPAAGSGALETLTDELCQTAWSMFQEIEREGGIMTAVGTGSLHNSVAKTHIARMKAIVHRTDPITGTSEFPNLSELPIPVLDVARQTPLCVSDVETSRALLPIRLAEPYEALRDRSDRILKDTGARPTVFLANLGAPADHVARAMFAKNFFAAGGIEVVDFTGTDLIAAYKTSGTKVVCLCSSDAVYAREAADAVRRLIAAGARYRMVAGRPSSPADPLYKAGIGTFIHAGCDAIAILGGVYASIEMR